MEDYPEEMKKRAEKEAARRPGVGGSRWALLAALLAIFGVLGFIIYRLVFRQEKLSRKEKKRR